jgi:membrane protein implicated in regulation of membrane protease activity
MDPFSWQWIWLALGIALLITEVATTALVVLPLAIGAFAAATVAFFGGAVELQFVSAAAVSVVSFAAIKPLAARVNKAGQVEGIGAHRLTNARGVALSDIDRSGTGMVQIGGEQWHGATVDDIVIVEGSDVRIIRVEGSKVMVVPHHRPDVERADASGDEAANDAPKVADSGINSSNNEEPTEEQQ